MVRERSWVQAPSSAPIISVSIGETAAAFETIPGVADAAVGAVGDELTFNFPEVLTVIELCTTNGIAVLGLELFDVRAESYFTKKLSGYESDKNPSEPEGWAGYVRENNILAEEFVRLNAAGSGHVYVLTTSSWDEFCDIRKIKRAGVTQW